MNSKTLLIVVIVLVLGGGFWWWQMKGSTVTEPALAPAANESTQPTGEQPTAGNMVEIKDFAYNPQTITVKVGDSVTWTNKDLTGHSATADDGSFDTGVLAQNESGVVTFATAGTFTYHCTPHPNIKGTVIVQ